MPLSGSALSTSCNKGQILCSPDPLHFGRKAISSECTMDHSLFLTQTHQRHAVISNPWLREMLFVAMLPSRISRFQCVEQLRLIWKEPLSVLRWQDFLTFV